MRARRGCSALTGAVLALLLAVGCGDRTSLVEDGGRAFVALLEVVPGSTADTALTTVVSAASLEDGSVVVLGNAPPFLTRFSASGRLVERAGDAGGGPGGFERPRSMAAVGGKLWILDEGGARIWSGLPLREERRIAVPHGTLGLTDACGYPGAVTVGSDGGETLAFNLFRQSPGEKAWEKITDHRSLEIPFFVAPRNFRIAASGRRLAVFHWQARELQVMGCDGISVRTAPFDPPREPAGAIFPRGMAWVGETVVALYGLGRDDSETVLIAWRPGDGAPPRQWIVEGDYRLEAVGPDRVTFSGYNPVPRLHQVPSGSLESVLGS